MLNDSGKDKTFRKRANDISFCIIVLDNENPMLGEKFCAGECGKQCSSGKGRENLALRAEEKNERGKKRRNHENGLKRLIARTNCFACDSFESAC